MSDNTTVQSTISELRAHAPLGRRIISNRMLLVGGGIVCFILLLACIGPLLSDQTFFEIYLTQRLKAPSIEHPLGTDHYGRDILLGIVHGARISMFVGGASVIISMIFGVLIGGISGFSRGLIDDVVMRIMDAILAFPPLLLAIGLVASMGPGIKTVVIAIGVVYIPGFARMTRSSVLAEAEKEYVEAVRAIGQKRIIILVKHIGINCLSPIFVLASVIFAHAIIIEATLSFLGIGIPPPTPSWGRMLDESRRYLVTSIYPALFPGLAISISVLGLNLLGDGLRDLFDPRTYNQKS